MPRAGQLLRRISSLYLYSPNAQRITPMFSPSTPTATSTGRSECHQSIPNKILQLEFFDMEDLCPELWLFESKNQEKHWLLPPRGCQTTSDQRLDLDPVFCLVHSNSGWNVPRVYIVHHTSWPTLLAVTADLKVVGVLLKTHYMYTVEGQPSKRPWLG